MVDEYDLIERRRSGWRRARGLLGLEDPRAEEFGTGGIAQYVPDLRFRVLILPADPESHVVEFDEPTKAWLTAQHPNPFGDGMMPLGTEYRVTANAAIRHSGGTAGNRWTFPDYFALLHCGGFEFGSGVHAIYSVSPDVSVFRLIYMVGRLWSALHLFREVIERFGVHGPWEISIALRNTAGSHLGHLASGWQEPTDSWARSERPPCIERHVLIRREVTGWTTDADTLQRLVFSLADNIQNCWGASERLYVSREGSLQGQFDTSRYR